MGGLKNVYAIGAGKYNILVSCGFLLCVLITYFAESFFIVITDYQPLACVDLTVRKYCRNSCWADK